MFAHAAQSYHDENRVRTRYRLLLAPILCLSLGGSAGAQEVVVPGPQDEPPGPELSDIRPVLAPENEIRRHVRGVPVKSLEPDDSLALLKEFERATFSPERARPDPRRPHRASALPPGDMLPPPLRAELRYSSRRVPGWRLEPEALRPDLTWLRGLETADMPVHWHPRLIRYLEFYRNDARGQAIIRGWLRAQGRYRALIEDALSRHELPEDLLYIPMIESGYKPTVESRVGAAGLWQFMPRGGRIYGLEVGHWVDERFDPVKSTEAAMLYWRDLYTRFGSWELAMAAYNTGYGAVLRSIGKYNTNDYWALTEYENGMSWGASLYVPKMLATSIVGHNREAFGVADLEAAPAMAYDLVTVPKSVALPVVARAAGVSAEDVFELNPHLVRRRTPPGVADFVVRIPAGRKPQFARTFPQLSGDWDRYDAYVVRHGERFEDIATSYGITTGALMNLNGITHESEAHGGLTIVVPRVDSDTRSQNADRARRSLYTSGVTPSTEDDALIVALPDPRLEVPAKGRVFYRVVTGDTLWRIARAFDVNHLDLARLNGLDPAASLHPRMILAVWVPPTFDASARGIKLLDPDEVVVVSTGSSAHLDEVERRRGRKRVVVVARAGDTLASVGRRFGLTQYDVARINRRSYNEPLEPGEQIVIYAIDDADRADEIGILDRVKRIKRTGKPKPRKSRKRRR